MSSQRFHMANVPKVLRKPEQGTFPICCLPHSFRSFFGPLSLELFAARFVIVVQAALLQQRP
eukprot:5061403-Amphidinium_carterae.1